MPPRDENGNFIGYAQGGVVHAAAIFYDSEYGERILPLGDIIELRGVVTDEDFTPEEATFAISPPRMRRKKFIKMMMSLGYPRNFARDIAEYCWRQRIPYCTAYFNISISMMFDVKN